MAKFIIFANGIATNPIENRHHIDPGDTIICADGGTLHALAAGITPDTIVGDLDSLPTDVQLQMQAAGVEILRHPVKKDQTDLELALTVAAKRGATEILLLALFGGRLDQQIANMMLLTRPEWAGVRLRLAEGNQQAWLLRGDDHLTLTGSPGDTLSVVTLSSQITGLTITGAEWTLHRATVPLGSTRTISNTFVAPEATVQIETGLALVIQIQISN